MSKLKLAPGTQPSMCHDKQCSIDAVPDPQFSMGPFSNLSDWRTTAKVTIKPEHLPEPGTERYKVGGGSLTSVAVHFRSSIIGDLNVRSQDGSIQSIDRCGPEQG